MWMEDDITNFSCNSDWLHMSMEVYLTNFSCNMHCLHLWMEVDLTDDSGNRHWLHTGMSMEVDITNFSGYYPPAIAVGDIIIAAVRPSHFLVYAITSVNMDGFEYFFACGV